jgi:quinoprotein glucose dehydrogenase
VQCNPVIVNGVMYAPTVGNALVAINAETGKEIWRFNPQARPVAQRGLIYWPGNPQTQPRILFTAGKFLYSLDATTGRPSSGFGDAGQVPSGGVVAPAIYKDVVVVANWNIIEGFDLSTGKRCWRFDVLGNPALGQEKMDRGGNCWGGIAMDARRGIVYISTGSPHPNSIGIDHPGRNPNTDSVIAIEATTGKMLWSFQEIRHDIWDLDIPAPPNLVTVQRNGKRVDAVAQVTKMGNTLLLDRLTGKPLFPFRLRRAPVSSLPGETTWPYQPDLELPQPFSRQQFARDQITNISPRAEAFVSKQLGAATFGWFEPYTEERPNVFFGIHGGAEWTGAAFDPASGWLYVSANHLPWAITVSRSVEVKRDPAQPLQAGEKVYQSRCAACHGEQREGRGMVPSLVNLKARFLDDQVIEILKNGRNSMPAVALGPEDRLALLNFLFDRDVPHGSKTAQTERFATNGYPKLLDDEGRPGSRPPWGTLNAINLNTGKIAWQVPLGEYTELTKRGIPITGTENFGGASVTAGGVVFCAGTRDLKIRAFDKDNGRELWSYQLPFGGFAPPAIYEAGGREYVVIAATSGGKLGGKMGDAYIAFALPR